MMNKEQAIEHLKLIRLNAGMTGAESFKEALDLAIVSLSQPSLPDNLDEAAEEYGRKEYSHAIHFWDEGLSKHKPEVMKEDFVDSFKAGAEWMAGQGQTFEAHVDNGCAIASGVKLPFVLWDTYEDGDVLKVQIRKKQ